MSKFLILLLHSNSSYWPQSTQFENIHLLFQPQHLPSHVGLFVCLPLGCPQLVPAHLPQKKLPQCVWWLHGRHPGRRPLVREALVVAMLNFALGSEIAWSSSFLISIFSSEWQSHLLQTWNAETCHVLPSYNKLGTTVPLCMPIFASVAAFFFFQLFFKALRPFSLYPFCASILHSFFHQK